MTTALHAGAIEKLGVYSRQSTLYRAFSELGRVERTRFLLQYVSDTAVRQHIRAETTKIESSHQFTDWMAFAGPALRSGDPVEQEKRIKYRDLVANAEMLHNRADITHVLYELQQQGEGIMPEAVRHARPFLTVFGGRQAMPSWTAVLGQGTISGEEVLDLPWRFEPWHPSFPLAGRDGTRGSRRLAGCLPPLHGGTTQLPAHHDTADIGLFQFADPEQT